MVIVECVEKAVDLGWLYQWIESISEAVVKAINSNFTPWKLRYRCQRCREKMKTFRLTHIWRKANFEAGAAAKKGASL